ncbi:MAG: PEP-utilizing enzyme [Deltaproteobacteria bacterium]|nr:PEP-utilizing enzyme [Deltaproteobacteria bacterium]
MANLLQRLKSIFSGGEPEAVLSVEEIRSAFRSRYHAFKLLLAANNTALQLMTDMEAALHGSHSFGMSFIRSHATAVCVKVFAMIKYLNELSGNRYQPLEAVFAAIEREINAVLTRRQPPAIQELVLPLDQIQEDLADGVGSKMANLGEIITRLPELSVPPGFAITAAAYELFITHNNLQEEINRRLQTLEEDDISDLYRKSSEVQMLIINGEMPAALQEAISYAYNNLELQTSAPLRVALRSSAIGEDAAETSFAGQYHSELNVSRENLFTVFKEILASKYALTAVSYRLHKGLRDEDVAMCVGCMAMVDSACGGVMYSRDPTDLASDAVFINAVHGLAKSVVDGSVTPDLYVVSRQTPLAVVKKEIREKELKAVCLPAEGVVMKRDREGRQPVLTDAQVLELARIALILEEHFHAPQDIEWCLDRDGRLLILQSRPLKQLAALEGAAEQGVPSLDYPILLRGGEMASSGAAAGPVYQVRNNLDLLQFPEGAVLVTAFPHPTWATLLSRAAAVVTDRGGITGHLANVAREFGLPALFNTGQASAKLPPGTVVTVDADGRSVYQGRVEELLRQTGARPGVMLNTPVGQTLKEVMTFITPLNLTNPEARDFRPGGCRTLHDLTRFAHEVAVKEMFAFEKHRALSKYFIKRLITDVGMEWWVLDLEDGFKEEAEGNSVELANIASAPMLALWQGITAAPWEGPPPVDTRGFMSIVMGAATDPNLAAAGGTIFGNQNYFMISRDFCNLTSRLGFHFSTVEALVGDQAYENYIRFSFKGGAADYPRRVRRARFVADLLEQHHFQVDVKEDALFARLEGEQKDYMLSRLRILGYLTIHTRQLDMIMLNDAEVAPYREKITADLEKIVASSQ